jgi:hypothetical protein
MKDDATNRDRQAAEQAAYEQIGEQEITACIRDDMRSRISNLRRRLPQAFAADRAAAVTPPQSSGPTQKIG